MVWVSKSLMMSQEFLPLCDVLFNIISMASYFCDVVFDVITAYTLYQQEMYIWLILAVVFILSSLIVSQFLSAKWFLERHSSSTPTTSDSEKDDVNKGSLVVMHFLGMGVLWRYFKLFIPVDLRIVKHEVRDLCMLRLVHAFIEAAPMAVRYRNVACCSADCIRYCLQLLGRPSNWIALDDHVLLAHFPS